MSRSIVMPFRFQAKDPKGKFHYADAVVKASPCPCSCGNIVVSIHPASGGEAASQIEMLPKYWREFITEFTPFLNEGKREGEL